MMKGSTWLTVGVILGVGVGVAGVCLAVASGSGQDAIERATKAGERIGEGVADLLDTVNEGTERVVSVAGHAAQLASDEALSHVAKIGKSARRTARHVGRALTAKA